MYIVACYNVWDDDANLRLSLIPLLNQVDEFIFLLGPYKNYPLYEGQTIEETNEKSLKMISNLVGDRATYDRNNHQPWESEIAKRNRYMELMDTFSEEDLWMLIIDSDEILASETGITLNTLTAMGLIPNKINFISLPIYQMGMMYNDIRLPIRLIRYPPEGLRYRDTHYHIYYGDTLLITDAILWDFGIFHLVGNRPRERIAQQEMYYQQIVEKNLEKNALYKHMLQFRRE
jgi:hypothetical protein